MVQKDADRKDHHVVAAEVEPPLQRVGRLVVQQPREKRFVLEDELAGKQHRVGKIASGGIAELLEIRDQIDAEGVARLRVPAESVGKLDQTLEVLLCRLAQIFDLALPLEAARVDQS